MITLHGFSLSNYYNKVKLALIEKYLPFEEVVIKTGRRDEAVLSCSPLGKIPYIVTEHGALSESQAILDYLEALAPNPPLLPSDPWQAAKIRELTTYVELHLELVARELYGQAFFGGEISEANAARVRKRLEANLAAFKRLAKFDPYLGGAAFTQADIAAWVSLPLVSMASKAVYGVDLMTEAGIDWKPYVKRIGERPGAQRVTAERKADQERAAASATPKA